MLFSPTLWVLFFVFILGAVFFDLFLLGRRKQALSLKQAVVWTALWIFLALLFNLLIYFFLGFERALEYLTAYLLEKSLSLDNLFVFLVIFSYFDLPLISQHKVLKWGILGAFLMRAAFIFGGIWVLKEFDFLFYIFGGFLIFSAFKLLLQKEKKIDPQKNLFLRIVKKFTPLDPESSGLQAGDERSSSSKLNKSSVPQGGDLTGFTSSNFIEDAGENRFFIKKPGMGLLITPLFLTLILIESSDLLFALDSVPAVLAITQNPFIAYTSNAFAILGLRAFYFVLAGLLPKFFYLKKAIIIILGFVGIKLFLHQIFSIPILFSLSFILIVILVSILLSLAKNKKENSTILNS